MNGAAENRDNAWGWIFRHSVTVPGGQTSREPDDRYFNHELRKKTNRVHGYKGSEGVVGLIPVRSSGEGELILWRPEGRSKNHRSSTSRVPALYIRTTGNTLYRINGERTPPYHEKVPVRTSSLHAEHIPGYMAVIILDQPITQGFEGTTGPCREDLT